VKRLLPTLIASAVLLALVLTVAELEPQRLADTLAALDWGGVALAFGVYALSYLGRGIRLAVLLPGVSNVAHFTTSRPSARGTRSWPWSCPSVRARRPCPGCCTARPDAPCPKASRCSA
jgi:hypothetical protein